jgi:phenylacetate-coenzyme A ligase PaaK-like adenylate-forming protein
LTAGLRRRARAVFGDLEFAENYGLTELSPMTGALCADGHLHFEPTAGIAEVLDPVTLAPVPPGSPGVLVGTPLPPYRETTLLLRYNTEDVVRRLEGPLSCSARDVPATSHVLGKLRLSVQHDGGWTFPREVVEGLEAVDAVPLPARYGMWNNGAGVGVEVVVRSATPAVRRLLQESLVGAGVPLTELRLVEDRAQLRRPVPLRCDLREQADLVPPPWSEPGNDRPGLVEAASQA